MASSNNKNSKKRKYQTTVQNPSRGPPGMLLTCETGREAKCRREGLEILQWYWEHENNEDGDDDNKNDDNDDNNNAPLNLEDELKQLKQYKSSNNSPFQVFETGCRGTVFVMCTNAQLIPPIVTEYHKKLLETNENEGKDEEESSKKKAKTETTTTASSTTPSPSKSSPSIINNAIANPTPPPWDPIATFQKIRQDRLSTATKAAPSSRFVTRMIPIQATCYASEEELKLTAKALLARQFAHPSTAKSFAIATKRRMSPLKRDTVIQIIAGIMQDLQTTTNKQFKVDLDKPDVTIVVEICKTLCGISVIRNCQQYQNFNLMTAGESIKDDKEDASKDTETKDE